MITLIPINAPRSGLVLEAENCDFVALVKYKESEEVLKPKLICKISKDEISKVKDEKQLRKLIHEKIVKIKIPHEFIIREDIDYLFPWL